MEYREPQFYRLSAAARCADHDVIDMVSGDPDWPAPEGVAAGLETYADRGREDPSTFQYAPSEGLERLRRLIADRRDVAPESVLVTHGATEGIALAIATALNRSDGREVVLADPTYPYYPGIVSELDGVPRYVETPPSGELDPAAVAATVGAETAAVVLNTPNNPTGAVYDRSTLEAIAGLAADVEAVVISDETYDHFVLEGEFTSLQNVDEGKRVVVGSFSKTFAMTGFRVGFAIASSSLRDAMRTRHMLTTVSGSRPAQAAVAHALETTPNSYYREARDRLRTRADQFAGRFEHSEVEVLRPAGGFYSLVRLPGIPGTMANAETLIEDAGVAAMPGVTFGSLDDWFRVALVTDRIEEATDRIRAAV